MNNTEVTFSCENCEYNIGRNKIGCGGHCLKELMYNGGASYLKKDLVHGKKNKSDYSGQFRLVICEKPSVAMQIARLLNARTKKDGYMEGSGWRVSWCLGHLLRMAQPDEMNPKLKRWKMTDLPILPEQWEKKWAYIPEKGKEKQLKTVVSLMNADDVTQIINACDAGREGELIFRQVYNYAGRSKPFFRLWIHSMEDKAILDGFRHLRSGEEMENLYQAAMCRMKADFLVGINATRKYGILSRRTNITVGRVQSPLLTMLVEREKEAEEFQPVPYFNVHLMSEGLEAVREKLFDQSEADALAAKCNGQSATVTDIQRKEKRVKPPKLYDLTMLQRDSNRLFGYSAMESLDLVQKLYEMKLISYPRTDSQYITSDMEQTVRAMVGETGSVLGLTVDFLPDVSRIIDNEKVSDHYALLPTATLTTERLENLPQQQKNILHLICHRLLCATAADHIVEETVVTLDCGGELFTAKGKRIIQIGWKAFELNRRDGDEKSLPTLEVGQILDTVTAKRTDHKTTAPEPFNEDTLLSAMENAGKKDFSEGVERSGLGTPATRAAIIEKVISSGYAYRKGKRILPTKLGRYLADALPDTLHSADLTAKWENDLLLISEGKLRPDEFMSGIEALTRELVDYIIPDETLNNLRYFDAEPVGNCPRCGRPVYESGKLGFFCSGSDHGCLWRLWKNSRYLEQAGITLDRKLVQELLTNGKAHVTGVKYENSNSGNLMVVETGELYPQYKYIRDER